MLLEKYNYYLNKIGKETERERGGGGGDQTNIAYNMVES